MAASSTDTTLSELFNQLELLLKSRTVGVELAARNVNASLALVAVQGLRSYLRGDRARAAEDFATVAEELFARMGRADRIERQRD
jgi:hypothetical protein